MSCLSHKDWNLLISFCISAVSRLDIGLSISQITAKEFNTIQHIIENLQAQKKNIRCEQDTAQSQLLEYYLGNICKFSTEYIKKTKEKFTLSLPLES